MDMIKLRTEIEPILSLSPIGCNDSILFLGSCFSNHIGQWLAESCLDTFCNPFGVLYNPASIGNNLLNVLSGREYDAVEEVKRGIIRRDPSSGVYYSFDHHGCFSSETPETLCSDLNALSLEVACFLSKCRHVFVTFGTSYVYRLASDGSIVANCHKFSSSLFLRNRLTVEDIIDQWEEVIRRLPDKHFLFTVSPIRHQRDTLHGNQLSKATLLLAIDRLTDRFPERVEYLPVYELFMDDLRDYRYYAEDLLHPSELAIKIVKEYFRKCCFSKEACVYVDEVAALRQALEHRPFRPDSDAYQQFLHQNILKIDRLIEKYHIFTLEELKTNFKARLL